MVGWWRRRWWRRGWVNQTAPDPTDYMPTWLVVEVVVVVVVVVGRGGKGERSLATAVAPFLGSHLVTRRGNQHPPAMSERTGPLYDGGGVGRGGLALLSYPPPTPSKWRWQALVILGYA